MLVQMRAASRISLAWFSSFLEGSSTQNTLGCSICIALAQLGFKWAVNSYGEEWRFIVRSYGAYRLVARVLLPCSYGL